MPKLWVKTLKIAMAICLKKWLNSLLNGFKMLKIKKID